jgi:hypothetical protein
MNSRWLRWCLLVVAVGLLAMFPLLAQEEALGGIAGSVVDEEDEAIAGAVVTVTNDKTKQTEEQVTGRLGGYEFKSLPPGTYRLQVKAKGFKNYNLRNIPVQKGESTYVDVIMQK